MGERMIAPFKFEPQYFQTIWGGNRLGKIRHLKTEGNGICREVCAYKNSESFISTGTLKGERIDGVIKKFHQEIMGEDTSDQLVRVAYIDAKEDLSLQVHPNKLQAISEHDYEKSESWYILDADEGAYVTAGTTLKDKKKIEEACLSGDIEKYLIKLPVKKGDFVLIPAGMIHACGKNMLAIEIGSFGGITYRLYDYGRPRKLDLEKGMATLDASIKTEVKHFPLSKRTKNVIQQGISHPEFEVDILDITENYSIDEPGYYILTCVEGSCVIKSGMIQIPLKYTETIFIPASSGKITVEGNCRLLKSEHPIN